MIPTKGELCVKINICTSYSWKVHCTNEFDNKFFFNQTIQYENIVISFLVGGMKRKVGRDFSETWIGEQNASQYLGLKEFSDSLYSMYFAANKLDNEKRWQIIP